MRLDGKQVFVEAFDGFFLEDKVNPPSSVQHSHVNLRMLWLFRWHRGLNLITHLCRDTNKAASEDTNHQADGQQEVSALLLLVKQQCRHCTHTLTEIVEGG